MRQSDIGKRMKRYEAVTEYTLPRRIPIIVRIDGNAFRTLTSRKHGKHRWSIKFVENMTSVASAVVKGMQGCDFCYCHSDEISFLLTDYRTITTEPWFGYDVRKLMSISAGIASGVMSQIYGETICFDSRCFSVPHDDVCNYFIWRQLDAERNAVLMLGREHFSQKQLHHKNCKEIRQMLLEEKGLEFEAYTPVRKRGFCIVHGVIDSHIPSFIHDRDYVEGHVYIRED